MNSGNRIPFKIQEFDIEPKIWLLLQFQILKFDLFCLQGWLYSDLKNILLIKFSNYLINLREMI